MAAKKNANKTKTASATKRTTKAPKSGAPKLAAKKGKKPSAKKSGSASS